MFLSKTRRAVCGFILAVGIGALVGMILGPIGSAIGAAVGALVAAGYFLHEKYLDRGTYTE